MPHPIKTALLGVFLAVAACGSEEVGTQPWKTSALGVETGVLWEVGTGTPFPYRLLQTQVSWRSKEFLHWALDDGSRIVFRHRLTLLGAVVEGGPESHYVAFSGSPSLEWWSPAAAWSLFTAAGGGFGLIDSRGIKGGQGQDLTLNWFARGGIEHLAAKNLRLSAAIMFQHMSNGGMTKHNAGIDAVGFMLGCAWTR